MTVRNNNADEGIVAFGLWLNDEERGDSLAVPIAMKEFHQDKAILLHDNTLQKDVIVKIADGVPFCIECGSDDCLHVGLQFVQGKCNGDQGWSEDQMSILFHECHKCKRSFTTANSLSAKLIAGP